MVALGAPFVFSGLNGINEVFVTPAQLAECEEATMGG
jgi:hypothetical protein